MHQLQRVVYTTATTTFFSTDARKQQRVEVAAAMVQYDQPYWLDLVK